MKINKTHKLSQHKLSQHKRTKRSKTKRSKTKRSKTKRSKTKRSKTKRSKTKRIKRSKTKPRRKSRKQRGGEEEYGFGDDLDVDEYIKNQEKSMPARKSIYGFDEDLDLDAIEEDSFGFENVLPEEEPESTVQIGLSPEDEDYYRTKLAPMKVACPDTDACLALGTFSKIIEEFFDFNSFKQVENIKRIGAVSANGFVNEITYSDMGIKSYAVLKSAQNPRADNLFYEYMVGKYFVNDANKNYPCFLETYGLFKYKTTSSWNNMQASGRKNPAVLNELQNLTEINYPMICQQSQYLAILIQHLNNVNTLGDLLDDAEFVRNELMFILFQIYIPLSKLSKDFTHYDLHEFNVLIYEPVPGKYITYHYYCDGKEIVFKSRYMAKIIDYGRSFFASSSEITPQTIHEKVCSKCDSCGYYSGFELLRPPTKEGSYIGSLVKNESHDLRLMDRIRTIYTTYLTNDLKKLLRKVVYEENYGTSEILLTKSGKINNVNDAARELKEYMNTYVPNKYRESQYEDESKKIGDLHIYMDGQPMKFE